tara:strand:+ start:307 stop:630 length:324 start_codon:yes stop_codon:yes gene_type:complete
MIPLFRTLNELMAITQSRSYLIKSSEKNEQKNFSISRDKFNMVERSQNRKKEIILPSLPKLKRRKWKKSKEAVRKFLDNLDYNNQIQSSLDLTLLERQKSYEHKDIA